MFRIVAMSLTVLVALAGCNSSTMNVGVDSWLPESNASGRLAGELPIVGAFDDEQADVAYVENWGPETYMRLDTVTDEGGWAMIGFTVYAEDMIEGEAVDVDTASAQGCSGSESGMADFDEAPESLEVTMDTVVEIDGTTGVVYTVVAGFVDGSQVEGQVRPDPNSGEE